MKYFIIAAIILFFNIIGFCRANNIHAKNPFWYKIYNSFLFFVLGCTIGIAGTLVGFACFKVKIRKNKKEERSKRKEMDKKIIQSPNIRKLAEIILKVEYLPGIINVNHNSLSWYADNNHRDRCIIRYQDHGISPIPTEFVGTLAHALADVPEIKKYWQCHSSDGSYELRLRREYWTNELSGW